MMKSPIPQKEQLRQLRLKKFKQKLIQRRKEAAKKAFMAYRKSAWRQMDSERQTQRKERVKRFRKSAGLASPRSPSGWEYRVRNWKCNADYPIVSQSTTFKTPRSDISNQETKFRSPLSRPEPKCQQAALFVPFVPFSESNQNFAASSYPILSAPRFDQQRSLEINDHTCARSSKVLRTSYYEDASSSSKNVFNTNSYRS